MCEKDELVDAKRKQYLNFLKNLGLNVGLIVLKHPLVFAKVLFQLGYEPYPLSTGKTYILFGRKGYFLPNVFSYLCNISRDFGKNILYCGIDANIGLNVISSFVSFNTKLYLDKFFPDIGGFSEIQCSDEKNFQILVRDVIRNSIIRTISTVTSRPFYVIMIREIAQIVGGETKYPNIVKSCIQIGNEEGISGFFCGLIPNLLAEYITIWGVSAISYSTNSILEHMEKINENDRKNIKEIKNYLKFIIPIAVNGFSYPFYLISAVLAVNGSGLTVSLLPYSPFFLNWQDAYNYFKPYGLTRGSRYFIREQKSAITVGPDHQLYANNKHLI